MLLAFDTEFVTGGRIFLKINGLEHCFLAPAKLPRTAILNNFIDKIVTAIKKSLKLLLYVSAEPTRKWCHTVKICLQPMEYMLYNFSNRWGIPRQIDQKNLEITPYISDFD